MINKPSGESALALGYGSVYNYANPANLCYAATRTTSSLTFVAARDIQAGEELTINYDERSGFDPASESKWMKQRGVDPI